VYTHVSTGRTPWSLRWRSSSSRRRFISQPRL